MATQAQDHIHLDSALGGPDGGPTLTFSALALSPEVRRYNPHVALEFAVDGTAMFHQSTSGGSVLTSLKRPVTLRVTRANIVNLLGLVGEYVYFIPPYHPDAGSPHAASAVQVYFMGPLVIGSAEKKDLENFTVVVNLQYTATAPGVP